MRDDSGVYEGFEVPIYYDPLLSKLITWGRTRTETIERMTRALDEYQIYWNQNHDSVLSTSFANTIHFKKGNVTTSFIPLSF